MKQPSVTFEEWETRQMQDPGFRSAVERLEPAYQAERWRILRKMNRRERRDKFLAWLDDVLWPGRNKRDVRRAKRKERRRIRQLARR